MNSSSSLRSMLGEDEVFDLVLDYLRSRQFFEAEKKLIDEKKSKIPSNDSKTFLSSNHIAQSKLESLLERSWVTSLVSEESQQQYKTNKRIRANLVRIVVSRLTFFHHHLLSRMNIFHLP